MADTTTAAIHPLRQRMIEDMTLCGLSPASQKAYIRAVRSCCTHVRRRPGDLTAEDARTFLLHLRGQGLSIGAISLYPLQPLPAISAKVCAYLPAAARNTASSSSAAAPVQMA